MTANTNTSQRNKGKQPSITGQAKQNPRFSRFPKGPANPPSRGCPRETAYEGILAPQEEKPLNWNRGETQWCGRKPGMVRFVRNSYNYPKATMKMSIQERRNAAVLLPSSVPTTEDKARQRRRRASQHMYAAQRPRGSRRSYKPQLSIKLPAAAAEPEHYPSKQWSRVRNILPAGRVPVVRAAAVRFPISRGSTPDVGSSPPSPAMPTTSMHVCFLCRCVSSSESGLCGACTAEYAMPACGLFDDGDDYEDARRGIQSSPRSYSSSIHSGTSSVYSSDATPINDDAMTVPPVSVGDAVDWLSIISPCSTVGKASVLETGLQEKYASRHGDMDAGSEGGDLYDLNWAEYHFNDEYFAGTIGG